jgi:hypothetical protein
MMEREHIQRPSDAVAPAPVEDAAPAGPESASSLTAPVPGVATRVAAPAPSGPGSSSADPLGGTRPSNDVVDALRRRSGSGAPLPPALAERFGQQFGTDLSGVRLHADSEAHELAQSVGAAAFTYGSDVYLSEGKSVSADGDHLIAHELAHVVQQASGTVSAPGSDGPVIGRADDPAEAEADRMADAALGALRRQAPVAGGADVDAADGAVRRLTVAQLRERHEEFIRAAGGAAGPQDESGADTGGEAKEDGAESGGSEHESETGSDADHGTDADSGNDLKDDIEDDGGNDSGNENDVTNENGNDTDVKDDNDTDVKDDNDTDVTNDNDTDTDVTNDTDTDVTNDTDTDTAENAGLPNPEKLRERIQLHKQASAILARGLGADVSSGDRERIVRAALDVLATDPWFEAFRFLQFDELVPFVRDRREAIERALAAVLKKSKAKAKGKGQESESDDTEGSEDASGEDSVVHLESGLLHRDDDAPVTGIVDTAASSAPDQGAGWESFAVGTDFTIRMSSHDEDETEESEDAGLLAESEALFSGEIMVRAGRIERMVNTGDRSKPSEEQMADFLRQLEDAGMSLEFDLEGFAGVADQTGAQILMEHEADEAEASQDAKA